IPIIKEKPSFLDLPHRLWFLLPARDFKFPCCDLPLPVDRICIWIAAASLAATVGLEAVAIAEEKGRRPSGRRLAPCHDMAASGGSQHRCVFDVQKQFSGAPISGDSTLHQPLGLPLAATAASVMTGVLGGAPTSNAQNAQIMLGMVTPQMIAGSGQSSSSTAQFSSHLGQASSQTLGGKLSKPPENLVPITSQSPVILKQASLPIQQVHIQPQYQLPPMPQGQVLEGTLPSSWPQSIGSVPRQPSPLSSSICPISQSQTPLSQQPVPTVASLTHHPQLALPNAALQQPNLSHSVRTSRIRTQSLSGGPADRTSMTAHLLEPISYPPSKLRRVSSTAASNVSNTRTVEFVTVRAATASASAPADVIS
ncbi:hypothetical protein B296_00039939, partial [Ensete ventricosum]